jgi:hypothetical protein
MLLAGDNACKDSGYAYKAWGEKDKSGKWQKKPSYLNEAPESEIYNKNTAGRKLGYGDTYLVNEIISRLPFTETLETTFGGIFDTLITLCYHRIIAGGPMSGAEAWRDGNYVRRLFPGADLSPGNIREVLAYLGEDAVQRSFAESYVPAAPKSGSVVVADVAGLPDNMSAQIANRGQTVYL